MRMKNSHLNYLIRSFYNTCMNRVAMFVSSIDAQAETNRKHFYEYHTKCEINNRSKWEAFLWVQRWIDSSSSNFIKIKYLRAAFKSGTAKNFWTVDWPTPDIVNQVTVKPRNIFQNDVRVNGLGSMLKINVHSTIKWSIKIVETNVSFEPCMKKRMSKMLTLIKLLEHI